MTPADFKLARLQLGLNQTALAENLGMTRDSISRMERGTMEIERRTELAVRYLLISAGQR